LSRISPLQPEHESRDATFLPWGLAEAPALVVESFGEVEIEYAALRKGCALFDVPNRGAVRVTGKGRVEFLNRMLTQELKGLKPLQSKRGFWLNRKGRIDADLRLVELPDEMWLDLDVLCAGACVKSLSSFVFSEEVEFADASESSHRLALHGPTAAALLSRVGTLIDGPPISDLHPGQACRSAIAGRNVLIERQDSLGEPGFELLVPAASEARDAYRALIDAGAGTDDAPNREFRLKPAGWHAYNVARIEAGWPLFNLDFGPESLPAETGVLNDRVSFTKGCYLGQEVVARMHALGHPKQVLVGLRLSGAGHDGPEWQPAAGAPVLTEGAEAKAVGAISSSTRSPMLGDAAVAFASVKWGSHTPGTRLTVESPAGRCQAIVHDRLAFWERSK
jgi:tRNA-modifying protein YgfZ